MKALVVYGANPMSSNPDQARVREGLSREDLFTVVIEQFPTDTVDYADIVLPATMQTEHLDVNDGYGHMYVSPQPAGGRPRRRVPVRRPRPSAGSRGRWGWTSRSLYEDDETLARTLLGDADFERLWRDGWTRLDYPTPFVPFTDGFPTPSGKLEFFSGARPRRRPRPAPRLRAAGADRATRPLSLIAPASHWFLNSMFANKPDLMKRAGEPRIELSPRGRDRARDRDRRRRRACSTRAARSWPWRRSPTASAPA